MTEVQFIDTNGDTPHDYAPRPAKDVLPEWWLNLATSWTEPESVIDKRGSQTAKRCMPMLDMLTSGYILVTPSDLDVSVRDDGIWYSWPNEELLNFHNPSQAAGHPAIAEQPELPKWVHPWGIKTPAGYSCLFLTPAHHPLPFRILEAVVDTDRYNWPVLFPFTLTPGFTGLIPAGTPMAQVIPFRRDAFSHSITADSRESRRSKMTVFNSFAGGYRHRVWNRKKYD